MKKKYLYMMFLFVVSLSYLTINKTYAKFNYSVDLGDNSFSSVLSYDIGIDSINQYQEVVVNSYDYEIVNIKINNNSSNAFYYGVWYKTDNNLMMVGILNNSEATNSDIIDGASSRVVSIILKNFSNRRSKVLVGINKSEDAIEDIEYNDGKEPVIKILYEEDYVNQGDKYISSSEVNNSFNSNKVIFDKDSNDDLFKSNVRGLYKFSVLYNKKFISGNLNLDKDVLIYPNVHDNGIDFRLANTSDYVGDISRIMYLNDKDEYVSGFGNGKKLEDSIITVSYIDNILTLECDDKKVAKEVNLDKLNILKGVLGKKFNGFVYDFKLVVDTHEYYYDANSFNDFKVFDGVNNLMYIDGERSISLNQIDSNLDLSKGFVLSIRYLRNFDDNIVYSSDNFVISDNGYNLIVNIGDSELILNKEINDDNIHYSGLEFLDVVNKEVSEKNYASIEIIVPVLDVDDVIRVSHGNKFNKNNIECIDNGSGCKIKRLSITDIDKLDVGSYDMDIYYMDMYNVVYKRSVSLIVE